MEEEASDGLPIERKKFNLQGNLNCVMSTVVFDISDPNFWARLVTILLAKAKDFWMGLVSIASDCHPFSLRLASSVTFGTTK